MNLSLKFRDQFVGPLAPIGEELDQLVASLNNQISFGSANTLNINSGNGVNLVPALQTGAWQAFDASGAGIVLTQNVCSYIKLGPLVICQINITYPATADGSNAAIGGFPFISTARGSAFWGGFSCYTPDAYTLSMSNTVSRVGIYKAQTPQINSTMSGQNLEFIAIYQTDQ